MKTNAIFQDTYFFYFLLHLTMLLIFTILTVSLSTQKKSGKSFHSHFSNKKIVSKIKLNCDIIVDFQTEVFPLNSCTFYIYKLILIVIYSKGNILSCDNLW